MSIIAQENFFIIHSAIIIILCHCLHQLLGSHTNFNCLTRDHYQELIINYFMKEGNTERPSVKVKLTKDCDLLHPVVEQRIGTPMI